MSEIISNTRARLLKKYKVTNAEYKVLAKERRKKDKKVSDEKHVKAKLGRNAKKTSNSSPKKKTNE